MSVQVVVGPPGTGKTTTLIGSEHVTGIVEKALQDGIAPRSIGVVSFTRAAVTEAMTRAGVRHGLAPDDMDNWRTLHSMGRSLQGRGFGEMLKAKDMSEFEAAHGYQVAAPADEDGFAGVEGAVAVDNHDQNLADVYQWSRATRQAIPASCATWHGPPVDAKSVLEFAAAYQGFKSRSGKRDFTDMLEGALGRVGPDLALLVIDEAQDLSPLQVALAEQLMARAKHTVVAGDDDQAIMGFQGASARWLIDLTRRHPHQVLSQSFRVPRSAHSLAQVIARRITERIPKSYMPRPDDGWIRQADEQEVVAAIREQINGGRTVSWLGRTRVQMDAAAAELYRAGVPFIKERGGRNPLGAPKQLRAARCALRILHGRSVDADDVRVMLDFVSVEANGLKRGAKKQAEALAGNVTPADANAVGLGPLWRKLDWAPWDSLDKMDGDVRSYYAKVLSAEGEPPKTACTVTSMHSSKGREWDVVVLSREHSPAVERSLAGPAAVADPEHRVAYVAVTRTRLGLILLDPPHRARAYRYLSDGGN